MKWTDKQKEAIEEEGKILVSAAAGSGKTAVLVERIIRIILEKRVEIEKIVVVTFTNAAAKEMKERIQKKITEKLEDDSLDNMQKSYLRKQLKKLPKANISTLHSYCFKIIRNNFFNLRIKFKHTNRK